MSPFKITSAIIIVLIMVGCSNQPIESNNLTLMEKYQVQPYKINWEVGEIKNISTATTSKSVINIIVQDTISENNLRNTLRNAAMEYKLGLKTEMVFVNADYKSFPSSGASAGTALLDEDTINIVSIIKIQNNKNLIKNANKTNYKFNLLSIAFKTPAEVAAILGEPSSREKINPSSAPCPCDKFNYKNDRFEIVYMNGKSDWITINDHWDDVIIDRVEDFKFVKSFEDYLYIKASTD